MTFFSQQLVYTGGALVCALLASLFDVRERRIPNRITGPAIACGLALHIAIGGARGFGDSAAAGLIAGALCLIFFLAGGMGAGDVKLMTAIGCFAGLSTLRLILPAAAVCAAILGLALSIRHGRLRATLLNVGELVLHHARLGLERHPDLNLTNPGALRLPFAVPVAAGCVIAVCATALEILP